MIMSLQVTEQARNPVELYLRCSLLYNKLNFPNNCFLYEDLYIILYT